MKADRSANVERAGPSGPEAHGPTPPSSKATGSAVRFASVTSNDYRCAVCGATPGDGARFDCAACGRPLTACANPNCGWGVRLFDTDDPTDCEVCGASTHRCLPRKRSDSGTSGSTWTPPSGG